MGGLVDELTLEEKQPLVEAEKDTISTPTTCVDEAEQSDAAEETKEDHDTEENDSKDIRIRFKDIGIWRIYYQGTHWAIIPGYETVRKFKEILEGLPYVWRFLKDIWGIAPGHFLLWMFIQSWSSIQGAVSLWCTAFMLQTMQNIIMSGKPDMYEVRKAFVIKFSLGLLQWLMRIITKSNELALKQQCRDHCGARLFDAYTRMDLVTLQRKDVQTKLSLMSNTFLGDNVWKQFCELIRQLTGIAEVASQGWFLIQFFRSQDNGFVLASVCILPQIIKALLYTDELGGVWFAYAINQAYVRARSLGDTAKNKLYFEEITGSGLYSYLQEEYHNAQAQLQGVNCNHVYRLLWDSHSTWRGFIETSLQDISLTYYLGVVALDPSSFSLTSLTVMRETAQSFMWTIWSLFNQDASVNEKLRFVRDYYGLLEMKNEVSDGLIPYPSKECLELQGMKIEFRNVSMRYPKSKKYALRNVSFTIPAGATVILVGENGSGKTTTVSLLSRLFDATFGEIFVDDRPISEYQVQTLREAQAILRQSYQHFPFSIKENIGIGDPTWKKQGQNDSEAAKRVEDRIMQAAKLGGAMDVIEDVQSKDGKRREKVQNFQDKVHPNNSQSGKGEKKAAEDATAKGDITGWDTNVTPVLTWAGSWQLRGSKLSEMSEEVEKSLELSGGQWQRLALARLFMRAEREQVRLVCTDEPSAALDPKAEYDIFHNLRTSQGRKRTRIFITHRFGHLTKHADLILCLKKGKLVECGTHEELMKTGGEYSSLYNIQAQAFQAA
ncbi:hypothetical protein FRC17_004076 [Serendipita sp. 399]|nr:hypothetical protein FRC17_004076 [Serendipita sp. 399]